MKKIIISLALIVLSNNFATAQFKWNDFSTEHYKGEMIIGLGLNIVDDSGTRANETVNAKPNWNFGGVPVTFSLEYFLTNKISVSSKLSVNKYNEGKTINGAIIEGSDANFFAADFYGKYSFLELLNSKRFEPYLDLGFGFTNIGSYTVEPSVEIPASSSINLNTGVGLNFWISEVWAINTNAVAKFGVGNDPNNYWHLGLGMIYSLPR